MKNVAVMNLSFNNHSLRAKLSQVYLYSLLFIKFEKMFIMDDAEILAVFW